MKTKFAVVFTSLALVAPLAATELKNPDEVLRECRKLAEKRIELPPNLGEVPRHSPRPEAGTFGADNYGELPKRHDRPELPRGAKVAPKDGTLPRGAVRLKPPYDNFYVIPLNG